jgi:hypothetical protein
MPRTNGFELETARGGGGGARLCPVGAAPRTREHRRYSTEKPRAHAHPCDALTLDEISQREPSSLTVEISQREPSSLTVEISLSFASEHSKLFIHRSDCRPLDQT